MRLRYTTAFAEDVEKQISFYTEKLHFRIAEKTFLYDNLQCPVLYTTSLDLFLIIANSSPGSNLKSCIILNTYDCLNDYYLLKLAGVNFCKEPQYLPMGMAAEFIDPGNNRVFLLEERDYNEPKYYGLF
jgi:catechol 2,3-dioxygenase-like lactoylglutathione lyase family enzyme